MDKQLNREVDSFKNRMVQVKGRIWWYKKKLA